MSRNAESRFAVNPTDIDIRRSRFDRNSSHKTSFNVGEVIPFYVDEVLPGDTFDIKTSKVVRLQTLLTPVMDNMYLDTYYFFVPNRLVWDHWKEFNGENTTSAWIPKTEYHVPQLRVPNLGFSIGSLADYFGIPTGVGWKNVGVNAALTVNALPFRAYALIINEWFRDQNLQDPVHIPKGDELTLGLTLSGTIGSNYITDLVKGGRPFVAAKFHDYFTSCLPAPQKGPDVTISATSGGILPVYAYPDVHPIADLPKNADGSLVSVQAYTKPNSGSSDPANAELSPLARSYLNDSAVTAMGSSGGFQFANLYAGDAGELTVATINQLRQAFQIQRMYEKDARGGTRYVELLKSHFGVTSPDYRLQRPEYLGGNRVPITINQVLQQSGTAEGTTPQGTTTGQSLTVDSNSDFVKSFTEHGFVIGLMVARYNHTYQQGLERFWTRKNRFDYYWPVFANLGEQAVKNVEIYAQGNEKDNEVFGYQEAWADYRYKPSRVSGEMRSSAPTSLDVWHLGDDYSSLPVLSDEWIREDKNTVDRVLAVTSAVSNQLFADIYIQNRTTRVMPIYSIPGLMDHH
ncbi:major capsid protein [Dipodfec virus RodF1_64]|uniref:Major capsid protein n=1 Tax=Dipodfec virus RodF1_64 TaxID=2929306 RepID=A0A976R5K3_9VIRU|nr:major capsid protein [Dipodfec virus RodF1_64]